MRAEMPNSKEAKSRAASPNQKTVRYDLKKSDIVVRRYYLIRTAT
jgi:hypothetical protein